MGREGGLHRVGRLGGCTSWLVSGCIFSMISMLSAAGVDTYTETGRAVVK